MANRSRMGRVGIVSARQPPGLRDITAADDGDEAASGPIDLAPPGSAWERMLESLSDRGEAEDLMQDVFLEIFNKAGQFDSAKGSAKTWILQYAYHRSLNRRQYLGLRNFYDRHQITENEVCESSSQDVSWRGLTFEEWRPVIEQGLAALNEKQRKTLELACFQGLLLSEIADRTKESLANVRHNYYRGLESLRKSLQAQHRAEEEPRKFSQEANDDES